MEPYNVALTPFDAIELSHGPKGLCPPGMGTMQYTQMAHALFELLSRILPAHLDNLQFWIEIGQNDDRNGYSLIHQIFTSCIPGFCNTATIS